MSDDPMSGDPFLASLRAWAQDTPAVVALVLCGSSAALARRDRWSDHDFLVVTVDGAAEAFRRDLSWLPDATRIGLWFQDTAHGLKALYDDGLLVELAVFDRSEFADCALGDYAVVVDADGVQEQAAAIHARSARSSPVDPDLELGTFLTSVYIGTGRARRGERISAGLHLRAWAVGHLLRLASDLVTEDHRGPLDVLDPARRVEQVDPAFADDLDRALAHPVDDVGPLLLDVADRLCARHWPAYPAHQIAFVRGLLTTH